MVADDVFIAAYGLLYPDWSNSVIASDLRKRHGFNVNILGLRKEYLGAMNYFHNTF